MSGGMHISNMTKAYAGFLKSGNTRQNGRTRQPGSFYSAAERIARSAAYTDAEAPGRQDSGTDDGSDTFVRDMTMEEYRLYIYDKISGIPLDPSQAGWNWHVEITEAGFEAMKKDPDYEAHVLDSIRRNFSAPDPFHSRSFSILHFGATEEESYGQSHVYDSPAEHLKKEEESFWEKRMARRKKQQELLEELAEKKAAARKQGLPEPTLLDISSILELLCADA